MTRCGTSNKRLVLRRWGCATSNIATLDTKRTTRSWWGRRSGLGRRDLAANVNWFSKAAAAAMAR